MIKIFIFLIALLLTVGAVTAEVLIYGKAVAIGTVLPPMKINEIMYDPSNTQGKDEWNEWIELYNPSINDVNVSGWKVCGIILEEGYINRTDGKTYYNGSMIIPSHGYAVITDGGTGTEVYDNFNVSSDSIALHVAASSICGGLDNGKDEIILQHANNFTIDFVEYSHKWGAKGNGYTLERINATGPSNSQENWKESYNIAGTPGRQNSGS